MITLALSTKILEFDNRREENTSSKLVHLGKQITSEDLTLCLDFKVDRVNNMKILTTHPFNDLEVQIPPTLDRFYIQVKGIFYLAPTSKIMPYQFSSFCLSYKRSTHELLFVHQGEIVSIKEDLSPHREFTPELLGSLELGKKDGPWKFIGDITRLNIWGSAMGRKELEQETSCCVSEPCQSGKLQKPDILDWDETEWDSIKERNVQIIPCLHPNLPSVDLVMPIQTDGVADAHAVCARLGGFLKPPKDEEDMQTVLDLVRAQMEKSDCSSGIWVPFEINQEDEWALTNGSEESLTPDHFNPPEWLGWSLGQPNGEGTGERLEKCAASGLDRPELFDVSCNTVGYCFVCTFEVAPNLSIRFHPFFQDRVKFSLLGACNHLQDIVDVQYIVDMEKNSKATGNGIVFNGFEKTKMLLDKNSNRWKIVAFDNDTEILEMAYEARLPIGPKDWIVPENICRDGKRRRKLVLTSCNETEFS